MSKKRNVVPLGTQHRAALRSKIEFQAEHNRSREPVTRSRGAVRGRFPSKKMGRMVDWESQLERRACYRFEFSTAVLTFQEQPQPIRFRIGDQLVKYTPDFELSLINGETWFVEIKPYDHLQRPDLSERLSLASEWYRSNGNRFVVITDKELIYPDLELNLAFLRHFLAHDLSKSSISHAVNWLSQSDFPTLGGLLEYFGDKVTAYALLSQHLIGTDLSKPIDLNSELFLPEEDSHATLLFSYRTAPGFGLCTVRSTENS